METFVWFKVFPSLVILLYTPPWIDSYIQILILPGGRSWSTFNLYSDGKSPRRYNELRLPWNFLFVSLLIERLSSTYQSGPPRKGEGKHCKAMA